MSEVTDNKNQEASESRKRRENFENFAGEFKNESDRAAVILGASKLDQLLGMLLEKYLIPCPNSIDQLFSNNGPLGTFSSKIDLCHRLGLIDSEFTKSIHLIRRLRNSFAHEVYGAKLSEGSHKDRVRSLTAPFEKHDWYSFLKTNYFKGMDEQRADFSSALGLMIVRLDVAIDEIEQVSDNDAFSVTVPIT